MSLILNGDGSISGLSAGGLPDSSVTTAELADNAVTTAKITDANVTTAKIADSNVTTAKIADSNVTTAKIADANVTVAKLSATGTPSSSTYLRGDGAWGAVSSGGPGGINGQVFTSTSTFTVPAGVTSLKLTVYGGGGGAGTNYGRSGGYGGYAEGYYTVTPGTTYTVTVGAGGAAGDPGGYAGGESWFGVDSSTKLIRATGGGGGPNSPSSASNGAGYSGTTRNGTVQVRANYSGGDGNYSGSMSAVTWSISSSLCPGANGVRWASGCYAYAAGGVSGAVYVEY